jgi:hypothetical protein
MNTKPFLFVWALMSMGWVGFWIGRFSMQCFWEPHLGGLVCQANFARNTDVVEGLFEMSLITYLGVAAVLFGLPLIALIVWWVGKLLRGARHYPR